MLSKELGMTKASALWVPRLLITDQKRTRFCCTVAMAMTDLWGGALSWWSKTPFVHFPGRFRLQLAKLLQKVGIVFYIYFFALWKVVNKDNPFFVFLGGGDWGCFHCIDFFLFLVQCDEPNFILGETTFHEIRWICFKTFQVLPWHECVVVAFNVFNIHHTPDLAPSDFHLFPNIKNNWLESILQMIFMWYQPWVPFSRSRRKPSTPRRSRHCSTAGTYLWIAKRTMLKNNWEIIVIYLRHSEARNFSVNPHISESDSEIREEFLKIDIINGSHHSTVSTSMMLL